MKLIIHVVPEVKLGGGITILKGITSFLSKEFDHLIVTHEVANKTLFKSMQVRERPHNKLYHIFGIMLLLFQTQRKASILHIHGRHGFLFFVAGKLLKIPIVNHHHGYYGHRAVGRRYYKLHYLVDYLMLKYSNFTIFTSIAEQNEITTLYTKKMNGKLIFNRPFHCRKILETPRFRNFSRLICLATSNIDQKGFDRQIKFFAAIQKIYPDLEFIHYLNPENSEEMQKVRDLVRAHKVVSKYKIKHADPNVWDYLNKETDCIVSTSRYEGRNLVLQEAFHRGFSTLATNCVGQEELLDPSWSNVLHNGDEKSWIETLKQLLENSSREHEKCTAAYNFISGFGGLEEYCDELKQLYVQL